MADNEPTPDLTQTPPGENPAPQPSGNGQPPGERVFTQAEVNRIVADRLARAKAQPAEPQRTAQPQPPKNDPPKNDPPDGAADALAILKIRDAFDDAISDLTLTGAQKKFARDLVMKERPADVAAYVSNLVELGGWNVKPNPGNGSPPPNGGSQPAPSPAPSGPPVTAGPPPSAPAARDDIPFHKMSPAQRDAYVRQHGTIAAKNKIFADMASVQVTGVRRT